MPLPPLEQVRAERERRAIEASFASREDYLQASREKCRSLIGFLAEAWHVLEPGMRFVPGWHLDAISDHLTAVSRGHITRLQINVPPATTKSLLSSVIWPAWEWGPDGHPELRFLNTSYSKPNIIRDNVKMRRLIESDWYQERWPLKLLGDQNAKEKFENEKLGFREGRPFGSMTGGHGDRVTMDDPHSTEGAESEAELDTAERIFRESIPFRGNNLLSAFVVIMQRLHGRDVCALIEQLGLPYVKLILPMEFDPPRKCFTSIGFEDPRTEEGELLCPERFSREQIEAAKVLLGPYGVSGQLQQLPAPRSGGLFEKGWFEVVPAAPANTRWVRGWDLAGTGVKKKKKTTAKWTVGLKLGVCNGVYYVGDVVRERLEPAGVDALIVNTATQDGHGVTIDLPQDPGQSGKHQVHYLVQRLAGFVVFFSPESGSKGDRAGPVASQARIGNVKLVAGPWNKALLDELPTHPNGAFSDQGDALSRAFARLIKPIANTEFAAPQIVRG